MQKTGHWSYLFNKIKEEKQILVKLEQHQSTNEEKPILTKEEQRTLYYTQEFRKQVQRQRWWDKDDDGNYHNNEYWVTEYKKFKAKSKNIGQDRIEAWCKAFIASMKIFKTTQQAALDQYPFKKYATALNYVCVCKLRELQAEAEWQSERQRIASLRSTRIAKMRQEADREKRHAAQTQAQYDQEQQQQQQQQQLPVVTKPPILELIKIEDEPQSPITQSSSMPNNSNNSTPARSSSAMSRTSKTIAMKTEKEVSTSMKFTETDLPDGSKNTILATIVGMPYRQQQTKFENCIHAKSPLLSALHKRKLVRLQKLKIDLQHEEEVFAKRVAKDENIITLVKSKCGFVEWYGIRDDMTEMYEMLKKCCANDFDYSQENKLTLGILLISGFWLMWQTMRFNLDNNFTNLIPITELPQRKDWITARIQEYIKGIHNKCYWMNSIVAWIKQNFGEADRTEIIETLDKLDNGDLLADLFAIDAL